MDNAKKNVIRARRFVRPIRTREAEEQVPLIGEEGGGATALTAEETNALAAAAEAAVAAEASHPVVFDRHPHFTAREDAHESAD